MDQMFASKAVNDHFKGISPTQEEKTKVKKIDPSKIRLLSSRSSKGAKKEIITINSQNIQKPKNERLKSARQIQIKPSSNIVDGQQAAGEAHESQMKVSADEEIRTEIESVSL